MHKLNKLKSFDVVNVMQNRLICYRGLCDGGNSMNYRVAWPRDKYSEATVLIATQYARSIGIMLIGGQHVAFFVSIKGVCYIPYSVLNSSRYVPHFPLLLV